MKIPYSWLREYCDPGVGVAEIAERLVMTGTEVERIGTVGPPAADCFVVGKVPQRRAASQCRPAAGLQSRQR